VQAPLEEKRDIVIAIDAGHGGKDPGAVGVDGIREKTVVLSIARRLAAKLDAVAGYRAVLVRDGDYYIPLRERSIKARDLGADLFVSVHADAFKSAHVSGASVFTLSDRGASSETARWLAERENSYESVGGVSLTQHDELVAKVLWDISMDASRSASIEAGTHLLSALGRMTRLHKERVEQAGFLVLKSPDVPSLLVETGFISNPGDARRLNTARYQDQLAEALAQGIRSYMGLYAPPGTLIAWQRERGDVRYTIERGDTLSEIAVRYGTSMRRIREANGLRGDAIRVGQTITIPAG
jgi:N-acetylmuramoyl-L-alanine amidase